MTASQSSLRNPNNPGPHENEPEHWFHPPSLYPVGIGTKHWRDADRMHITDYVLLTYTCNFPHETDVKEIILSMPAVQHSSGGNISTHPAAETGDRPPLPTHGRATKKKRRLISKRLQVNRHWWNRMAESALRSGA